MRPTIRIGIADPDHTYRSLLVKEICSLLDRKVQFCASNGKELIEFYKKDSVDLLITNLYMPVISGYEVVKLIRQTDKKTRILTLSSLYQADIIPTLRQLPADGYCSRNLTVIQDAVNHIIDGNPYFDQLHFYSWERETASLISTATPPQITKLKPVEISIIQLTYEGRSNKEIAGILNLSKRTIDTYVRELLIKLGLKAKLELVAYAADNGICKITCANNKAGHCLMQSFF